MKIHTEDSYSPVPLIAPSLFGGFRLSEGVPVDGGEP